MGFGTNNLGAIKKKKKKGKKKKGGGGGGGGGEKRFAKSAGTEGKKMCRLQRSPRKSSTETILKSKKEKGGRKSDHKERWVRDNARNTKKEGKFLMRDEATKRGGRGLVI